MTKNTPAKEEEGITFTPLVADIFTAMATQSENTTNRVFDNYDSVINDWKAAYVALFDAVDELQMTKLGSLPLDHILSHYSYTRGNADSDNVWTRP